MSVESILLELNPEQRAAVTHGEGPLLVVAGAGTGKTTVLTRRIAWLIAEKRARPEQVLALTFSDKAAQEMEERVDRLVPYGFAPVNILTFHAFGQRLFEANAMRLGHFPAAEVLSGAALRLYLKKRLFELPLKKFRPLANPAKHVEDLLRLFSRAKDEAVSAQDWEARASGLLSTASDEAAREEAGEQLELAHAFGAYNHLLRRDGFLDHGDQLVLLLQLLREDPLVLKKAREAYPWILVDEFQDTNTVQFEILKLLAPPKVSDNLTVVGDDDQAIYRFRGASLSNILSFRQAYPHAGLKVVTLNYRSQQDVLDCAYRLIGYNNPGRLEARENIDKRLKATRPGRDQAVFYKAFEQLSGELSFFAEFIGKDVKAGKRAYRDFAILARSNAQAEAAYQELAFKGIPARFPGARGLYRREEIRLCLRFLYALARPEDDRVLFDYLADKVVRVPVSDLRAFLAVARSRNLGLYRALTRTDLTRGGEELELDPEAASRVEKALTDLSRYGELAREKGVGPTLYQFLNDAGILSSLLSQSGGEAPRQVANLARLFDRLKAFDRVEKPGEWLSVIEYLEALIEEGEDPPSESEGEGDDSVTVSTVHMSKGLEWPCVFVMGLEDRHFPMRSMGGGFELPASFFPEGLDEKAATLAEERRLFYVAMTRARDELYLCWAADQGTKKPWKRSPFLQEALNLPKEEEIIRLSATEKLSRHAPPKAAHPLLLPLPLSKAGEAMRLSYYPVDDYLTCPLKYKIAHGLKLKPPPSFSISYGNVMHQAVQEYNRARMEGRHFSLEQLKSVYEQAWSSQGYFSREHEEERFQNGLKRLDAFYEDESKGAGRDREPIKVEHPFEVRIAPLDILAGRMDRVDKDKNGELSILDYKTSNVHDLKKAKEEVKKSLQLAIYALAWKAQEGRLPDWLELYFLESGIRERIKPDEEYLREKEQEIRSAFDGIRAENFEARPDFMSCKICAYGRICPESKAG